MHRRTVPLLLTGLALFCISELADAADNTSTDRPPNIVVILVDDQGWGDLRVNGNTNVTTPHIDSLARDGALFEYFYVSPVCSPTRAEFLTGRYHPRGGVHSTSTGGERLDLDERTIAECFQAAGYATGAFGKWHNGMQHPYHPNSRGFDEFYGFCSGHWGHYFSPELEHNGRLVRGEGYIIDDFTNRALAFMEENKDRPFFCYLPYNTPHSPMQVPDRFYQKFADADLPLRHRDPDKEDLAMTRAALAMCENIDWNVGRVLAKLDDLGAADDTIVVYFTDNGPNSWRYNGGMRGRKGSTDEGGVRSPLFVRWSGRIPAGRRIDVPAAAIDLLPTLTELAGVDIVGDKPLDGVSLATALTEEVAALPADRMIFSYWNGRVSVRTDRYRLDHQGRLYDIGADPGQRHDIQRDKPEVTSRLAAAVESWKAELLPELKRDERPFPVGVGYPKYPLTHLPARDGVAHGNVKRSAGAPNCSYFTNWTSTEDSITWDIDVAADGTYEAVLYYTCRAQDVGSTIELSFGESRVAATIAEAHDPPLVGAAEDRASRGSESYVKDFKPLSLGKLSLTKARGQLALRAIDVPGKQVADVRYVVLNRLD